MEEIVQGYVFYLPEQPEKELVKLLETVFSGPVWYFDGQVKKCSFTPDQKPAHNLATLSGRAFDSHTEIRWRQLKPGEFDITILTEDTTRLPASDEIKTFIVDKGRTNAEGGWMRSPNPNDRRWPDAPRIGVHKISYVYYCDSLTGQVRFMRLRSPGSIVVPSASGGNNRVQQQQQEVS